MCTQPLHIPFRRGTAIFYSIIVMMIIFGFASLGLDLGKVQLAKTQLRIATDQAGKWGVRWVSGGTAVALSRCNAAAAENHVDGVPLTLSASDVAVGNWNLQSRVFTANARPRNAIQVSAARQVALALGPAIGVDRCAIRASSVTMCQPQAFVVLNGATFKNNILIASYDSSVTLSPNQGQCSDGASLLSNGRIGDKNNGGMRGDVYLSPTGSIDPAFIPTGGIGTLASVIVAPPEPAWSPAANPGGVPQNYTVNANTTLAAGTYWFTSLTVNARLSFSGPATVYVSGDIVMNNALLSAIVAYGSVPANLQLYQIGPNRKFTAAGSVYAKVFAPRSDLTSDNDFSLYGSCFFSTITTKNDARFFYDESIGAVSGISVVK